MDIDLTLLVQLGLLTALVALLRPLLFTPLLAVIDSRSQRIQGTRAEAERLRRMCDADQQAYATRMDEAQRAALHAREALRQDGRRTAERIAEAARQRAAGELLAARREIGSEAERAAVSLAGEIEPLAAQVVERVLREQR